MAGENQRRDLARWNRGPRGFLPKANEVIDAVNELRSRPSPPSQVFTTFPRSGGSTSLILVRIDANATLYSKTIQWGNTGSAVSTAVAWTYGGVECRLDTSSPDGSVVAVSGGKTFSATGSVGSSTPPIFNPHEFSATTTIVGGIEVDSSNFPAGHRYRPLDAVGTSMSHAWTPVVWVTTMLNSDGNTIYVVVSPRNQFDGSCT